MGEFKNGLVWVATVTFLVLVVFCSSRFGCVEAEDFEWEDNLVSWEENEGISPHVVSRRDVHKEVQECKGLKKGKPKIKECKKKGKLPVKDECRIFLRCAKAGEKPTPTCCPNGLHFDHRLRTCIGRKDAHCLNMCPENGTKYPDPNNFKQFLQCSSLGVPEEVPCPEGEHYVPKDSKCAVLGKEEVAKLAAQEIGLDEKVVDDIVMGYEFPPQIISDINGTSDGNGTGNGNSTHSGSGPALAVNVTVDYETDAKGNVVGVSEAPGDDDDDASTTTPSSGIVASTTDDSDEDDNTVASLPLCSTVSPEALSTTTEATTIASDSSTTPNPGGNATVVNCINDENEEILPTNQTSGSKKIPQGRVFKMNFQADISFGAAKQEKKAAKGKTTTAKPAGATATTTKAAAKAAAVKAKSASGCRSPTKKEEKEVETCKREGSIPLKNECRLFQKCYGPGKQPMFICCQAGMKFHHVLRRCVSEKEARCGPKVCSRKGIKYPHPDGGQYYLMCTKKGIPEEFECKDGAMYDDSEKKCMDSGLSNDMVNEMIANAAKKNGTKKSSGNATVEGGAGAGGNGTSNGNSTTLEDDDADMALLVQETLEGYHALNSTDDDEDGEMPVDYEAGVEGSVGGGGGGNSSTVASVDGGSSTLAPDGSTTVGGEAETTTGTTDTTTAAARKRKREVNENYF